MGHAWQALALTARAIDCEAFALGHFPDHSVTNLCGFSDEWPLLLVVVQGPGAPVESQEVRPHEWLGGAPNALSPETVPYPLIDDIHAASNLDTDCGPVTQPGPATAGSGQVQLQAFSESALSFGEVVRKRRSALDFQGGTETISFQQLSTLLEVATRPFAADFEGDLFGTPSARYIQLYLYVHRVSDLEPGVYRYWPEARELELLRTGDQRVIAAALSLGQELAGNACVAFSMIADLERAARHHGNRGYRYVHFEAGAIGHRLYLASEALGFQSTGVGAFYDDDVHRYLGIPPEQGQVVYHFACGYAVTDERLEG
jgi:SagB-type dehydrogenase family enzyme